MKCNHKKIEEENIDVWIKEDLYEQFNLLDDTGEDWIYNNFVELKCEIHFVAEEFEDYV